MTGVTVGFDDWARGEHTAGQQKLSVDQVVANGNEYSSQVFYTGNYGYLNLVFDLVGLAGYYNISVVWVDSQTSSTALVSQEFIPQPQKYGAKQYPVLSEWAYVTINHITSEVDPAIQVRVFGTNAFSNRMGTEQPGTALVLANGTVSAGATIYGTVESAYEGPVAIAWHQSANTSWYGHLDFWDATTQAYIRYLEVNSALNENSVFINAGIPPVPARMSLHNTDTASHGYFFSMVAM